MFLYKKIPYWVFQSPNWQLPFPPLLLSEQRAYYNIEQNHISKYMYSISYSFKNLYLSRIRNHQQHILFIKNQQHRVFSKNQFTPSATYSSWTRLSKLSLNYIQRLSLKKRLFEVLSQSQQLSLSKQFYSAFSQQSFLPLKQGRIGTPLSNWQAQEQAALSTNSTSFIGLPRILRSLTKQPEGEMVQCSRQSRWWMRSPRGSRQSRIQLAQQDWLAVNTITQNLSFRLLSNSTAPGLMLIPASVESPLGNLIVILMSYYCSRVSLQCMRVSSISKTIVFLFQQPGLRGNDSNLSFIYILEGTFEFYIDFRICKLVVRCSFTTDLESLQPLSTSETQQCESAAEQGSEENPLV